MLMWGPFKLLSSLWNCLKHIQHCSLQEDEAERMMWLVRGDCALTTRPTVSAANPRALPLSERSQEPRHPQPPLLSLLNSPTAETAPSTSQLVASNSQYSSDQSDVSTESSSDVVSRSDEETNALKNMSMSHPDHANSADAVVRGMLMLDHLHSQIQEAELDLGQQLLSCKEPYNRIRSLKQHYLVARQSVEQITSHFDKQELRRIGEGYYCKYTLQNVGRNKVLHPDPEIRGKQDSASKIGRAFIGDPEGVLCDILSMQTYPLLQAK